MSFEKDRSARSFINTTGLHADHTVLNDIGDADSVLSAELIYFCGDLGEFNLAQDIYRKGEVDISPEQAKSLKKYTQLFTRVIDRIAVSNALSQEE